MNCCKPGLLSLAHDCEQLEPEIIICPLNKIANGTRNEICRSYPFGCRKVFDLSGKGWIERRQKCGDHVFAIMSDVRRMCGT